MKRFEGKVAVITGGNSGIGLATAKRFSDEGAKVAISGRSQKTLDEAAKYVGNGIFAVKSDVSKLADLDRFYSAVKDKFGKIDKAVFSPRVTAMFKPMQSQSFRVSFNRAFRSPSGHSCPSSSKLTRCSSSPPRITRTKRRSNTRTARSR